MSGFHVRYRPGAGWGLLDVFQALAHIVALTGKQMPQVKTPPTEIAHSDLPLEKN
jgi:hypothetical protein